MPRGTAFAEWWADRYTRGLPPEVRDRRRAEIESDVFEQLTAGSGREAAVAWRMVRGIPADLAWRRTQRRMVRNATRAPSNVRATWRVATQAWFAPLAVLVGAFDLLLAWGVATEPDGKMPGQAVGPVAMVALGVALFVGLWMRWRATSVAGDGSGSGARPTALASHPALADGLIVVGVLPALAFFWMIVPPLVALAVIVGVAGVGSRSRTP